MNGIPGVILHPLPNVKEHNTLHELTRSGKFSVLLQQFIGEVTRQADRQRGVKRRQPIWPLWPTSFMQLLPPGGGRRPRMPLARQANPAYPNNVRETDW